jgi:hypothetical protein
MPIVKKKEWDHYAEINDDPYSKAVVDTARRVMEILDEEPDKKIDCRKLICRGDDESNAGGITGFMAGCVASIVSQFHSRGEEFRTAWNLENQIQTEGEEANKKGGVLNPALLTIETK